MTAFEEVYRSAYSHPGLESIYALENVDVTKIRRIEEIPAIVLKPKQDVKPIQEPLSFQLEFNFGDGFHSWMESFVLDEPLQVLGLSRHAERCLNENGKFVLRHLIGLNFREFIFFKGMGQGHIDEIQSKLNDYLKGHILERCPYVDFSSWMRVLVKAHHAKKTWILLEPYELSHLITLSPSESVEVRRLTLEKKSEWREEMEKEMEVANKKEYVHQGMQKIVEVFIQPWLRMRMGIASLEELTERLQRVSKSSSAVTKVLNFLQDFYFSRKFPLVHHLPFFDGLFFIDLDTHKFYSEVVDKALSYFYKGNISYSMVEITSLIEREFAKIWQGFPDGFVEKCLKYSRHFTTYKRKDGELAIQKAWMG